MTDVRPGYTLLEGPPSVVDYLALRRDTGMHPKTREQAEAGIAGAWAAVHVRHLRSGATVGMGRVIGDGGWYFHVIDMAVLPEHQRQGLGSAVLEHLLDTIRASAPPGAYVRPHGRRSRPAPVRASRLRGQGTAHRRDEPASGGPR